MRSTPWTTRRGSRTYVKHPGAGPERALVRAYALQVETLRRLRNGGSQIVRVEHVHVNEGGQAVIGHVNKAHKSDNRGP